MLYSSIIFDLDGTLLDTLQDIAESVNSVLTLNGFPPHPCESYKVFIGNGLYNLILRSVPAGTSESIIRKCCDAFDSIYSKNWRNNCCPYKGINTMLADLSGQGITLAVLSNKPHAFTCLFVDQFFPKNVFEIVFGQRDDVKKKPDPAGALAIAGLLQTQPENILFVGDSDVDIQTGRNAGMGTAGVSWGYRNVDELAANNAEIIVNSPLEIVEYVLSVT
jgi:phosphoglycolate phosphatase